MRWYKIVFAILFALLLIIGLLAFLLTRHMTTLGLDMVLSKAITGALGNKVVIGNARIVDFRTIEIDEVTLFDKFGQPIARVPKTEVRFSPFGIFSGLAPDNFISSITVYDVQAFLVERTKNTWNVEEIGEGLPKSPKIEPLKFKPEIRIVNATVSAKFASGAQNMVSEVTGILDLSENDMVRFKANINKALGTKVTGSGYYDLAKDKLALSIHTNRINLRDGSFLFIWKDIPEVEVKLLSGYANNLDVYVTIAKGQEVKFSILGDCIDAGADIFGVPVRNAFGRLEVNEKKVSILNGRASAFGDTVNITGDFNFAPKDFRDFELNVVVVGKGLHTSVVNRFLPGFMPVDCQVDVVAVTRGKLAALNVEASIEANNVSAFGYNAQKIQAKAAIINGRTIVVSDGLVSAYGGGVRFSGDFDIDKFSYNLKAAGSNVNVSQLPFVAKYNNSARASFSLSMCGDKTDYVKSITGNVAAQDIHYDKYVCDSAVSGFSYDNKKITIDYLNGSAYGGQFSAYGKIGQELAIKVRTIGVDGSKLAALFGQKQLSGTCDASMDINGTIVQPDINIEIGAVNGKIIAQNYKSILAKLELVGRELKVEKIEARDAGDGYAQASGTINLDDYALKLSGDFSNVLIQDIVRSISPQVKVLGAVNGNFELGGSLSEPLLATELSTGSIVYGRYLANSIVGKLELTKGGLVLRSLKLQALGAEVTAEGTWQNYSDMDFLIKANGIDLEKLPQNIGENNLIGTVSAKMFLKGTIDEPMLFGKVTAPEISYNKEAFTGIWAELSLSKDVLDIGQAELRHKFGLAKFEGSIRLDNLVFAGSLSLKDMDISDLMATAGLKDENRLNGALSLQSEFSGTVENPTVKISAQAPTITSYGFGLDDFVAECYFSNKTLTISKLFAKRGDSIFAGKGVGEIDGPLAMEVGARNIDASLLAKWSSKELPLTGNLSATAQITGTYKNPAVALSVTLDKPSYAGTQLDEIFGLLTIDKDKVNVNQILLSKAGYKATLIGEVPYDAMSLKPVADGSNAQMNLKFTLEETDMKLLPLLFSDKIIYADGLIGANVVIGGTLQTPLLNGNFSVKNGTLQLAALKEKINNVNIDIVVQNNSVNINKTHGEINNGTVDISGTGMLLGWKLVNYGFSAVSKNVDINTKQYSFPIALTLNLNDQKGKAKLSGNLYFKKGDIVEVKLNSLIGTTSNDIGFVIPDIDLDVTVDLGPKLRVYNPFFFDLIVTGKVHFGGSTILPDNQGQITTVSGQITYMNNEFNIEQGEVDFNRSGSNIPNVNIQAKASVSCPDPINPGTVPPKIYTIYLTVQGTADNPIIKLSSDGGLSGSDIGYLLTTGQAPQSNGNAQLSQAFANQAINTGLRFAQSAVFGSVGSSVRTNLGLDYFSLNRAVLSANIGSNNNQNNVSNQEIYQLEVGKYLFDKLLLKSMIGIGYNYYQFQVQYDLWQKLYLTGSIDSQQNNSIILNKIWTF
ncbi:MAG: translocation/assembly module TamB domain-containing protein [Negativicutes bacterium]|jgi:translocation and assembly module TamB